MDKVASINNAVSHAEAVDEQTILEPADPMGSARVMVDKLYTIDGTRTLHRYRGEFWQWHETHYRSADDEMIRSAIWEFLDSSCRRQQNKNGEWEIVPFRPNRTTVANVFDALGAICQLDKFTEPPTWLTRGQELPANQFLAVANGILHLPTRELHSPTPTYFAVSASTVAYDAAAPEPEKWLTFLTQVLKDTTAISTLQEWFGYTLAADTSQEKILFCIGDKRSGKGTVARVQTGLLGKNSVAGPTMSSLSDQFGLEPLIAKPLAIISDARIGKHTNKSAVVERLLSISGEDTITVARKFKAAWDGRLPTRIQILTNEMMSLTDGSGALVSRLIVLLFQESFYGREDVGLTNRLMTELPGILNWAIDGYQRLHERGHFIQPENAKDEIEQMDMLGAPVKAFVRDRCDVGVGYEVEVDTLYSVYMHWCDEEGIKNKDSKAWFCRNLNTAVRGLKEARLREGQDRKRVYRGIRLAPAM